MVNEVAVRHHDDDGYEGFTEETEGGQREERGLLAGTIRAKFTNSSMWVTADDDQVPDKPYVAGKVTRCVLKWGLDRTQPPIETRELAPGERFPDLDELNASCPKSEWSKDLNGNPRGPWMMQHILF